MKLQLDSSQTDSEQYRESRRTVIHISAEELLHLLGSGDGLEVIGSVRFGCKPHENEDILQ